MIPLYFLLIPYGLFLIFYSIFFFFNIYHLHHFSIKGSGGTALIFFFIMGTVAILGITALLLQNNDWSTAIDLQNMLDTLAPNKVLNPL